MKKGLESLISGQNLLHVFLNMLIVLAMTIVVSTDTINAMIVKLGLGKEATILLGTFIFLLAKEFLLKYKKKANA